LILLVLLILKVFILHRSVTLTRFEYILYIFFWLFLFFHIFEQKADIFLHILVKSLIMHVEDIEHVEIYFFLIIHIKLLDDLPHLHNLRQVQSIFFLLFLLLFIKRLLFLSNTLIPLILIIQVTLFLFDLRTDVDSIDIKCKIWLIQYRNIIIRNIILMIIIIIRR